MFVKENSDRKKKFKNSMKGLINIKNNGSKYFLWCHIRNLNAPKIHPERITKADKDMVSDLDYKGINFTVSKKDYYRIEQKKCLHQCILLWN